MKKLLGSSRSMAHLVFLRLRSIYLKLSFRVSSSKIFLGKNIQIIGFKKIRVGKGCSFGDYLWLNIDNKGYKDNNISVHIGNYSNIGRNNFITVGSNLVIGDYFFSSCYCSIIGASHQSSDPFTPYIVSEVVSLGNGVRIGTNVFMGANSMIVGPVDIGFGSIIGSGALVNKDIPPLSVVVGNPGVVIKRFSLSDNKWIHADEFNDGSIIDEDEYLNLIKQKHPGISVPYHAATEGMGWT